MTTIDLYLLRQFIRVFVMMFISLLGIFVVADFVGNLSEFVDYGKESQSMWSVLAKYYGARVPWFFDIAGRVIALLAAVFALAWMQRDNELTALMAAGISRWRVAKPLIFASVAVAVLAAVNREYWVPQFRLQLCRNAQDLIKNQPEKITPKFDSSNIVFDGDALLPSEQRIVSPKILLPNEWSGVGDRVVADSAQYLAPAADRPGGYLLDGVQSQVALDEIPSFAVEDRQLVLTPRDYPQLAKTQVFVVSTMSLDQLRRGRQWHQYTATVPLIAGLQGRQLDYSADVRVLVHSRFVQPLLDVTLVFLGLPLAFGMDRRQVIWSTAKSMLAAVVFTLVVLVCHGLGVQCIVSPALSAWLPAIILVPLAFLLSGNLRR